MCLGLIGYHEFSVSSSLNLLTACLIFFSKTDNLNTQVCRTLKKSPYEVVFGQPPRLTPLAELPEGANHCIMEEDLADIITG